MNVTTTLSRKLGQKVRIGDTILLQISGVRSSVDESITEVTFGIQAPKELNIDAPSKNDSAMVQRNKKLMHCLSRTKTNYQIHINQLLKSIDRLKANNIKLKEKLLALTQKASHEVMKNTLEELSS